MNKGENKLRIGVDVRMLKSSGIGKVIENILIRMIPMKPEWDFYLIGKINFYFYLIWYTKINFKKIRI